LVSPIFTASIVYVFKQYVHPLIDEARILMSSTSIGSIFPLRLVSTSSGSKEILYLVYYLI